MIIDDFIINALFVAVSIALASGPLGSFVIWRRMAYFGDSLAHSALLGVALGIAYDIGVRFGILMVCGCFSVLLTWLQTKRVLGMDALLGIFAHTALAIGVVVLSFLKAPTVDIHSILFGDILTVISRDIYTSYLLSCFIIIVICLFWKRLVLSTLSEDIAAAEGFKPHHAHLILTIMMTIFVAFSVQIVGVLLVTSLLIIPAATARLVARTPHMMAFVASSLGVLAVILGTVNSVYFDSPPGPVIVSVSGVGFLFMMCIRLIFQSLQGTR